MDFPVFQFVPLPIYHFPVHHWEKPGSLFTASHQILVHTVKVVHNFLHVGYQPWAPISVTDC